MVKNIYATYTVHLPGNIVSDNNDNAIPGDTLYVIYVETTTAQIHWIHAWKDGKDYSVLKTLIPGKAFDAGTAKTTNEKIIVNSGKGNKLWKLQLVREEKFSPSPVKHAPREIILQGTYEGQKITKKIIKQTEIVSIPFV